MRQLAKRIELEPSAVSLMLRGMRKMTLEEANKIASLLGVQVTEVLRQAGVPVSDDVRGVALVGYVDANSTVKSLNSSKRIVGPPDVPHDGSALQVRAPSTFHDGWLLFVGGDNPPEAFQDMVCVITLTGGKRIAGTLRRGYESGTYNVIPLMDMTGKGTMEDQTVESVAPVLWMRPQ